MVSNDPMQVHWYHVEYKYFSYDHKWLEEVVEYLKSMYILFCLDNKSILPSKILVIIPGPSSTDKGLPVRKTGSPTVTPAK